jgi:hypothetical protein
MDKTPTLFEDSTYDWDEMLSLCDQNLIDMDIPSPLDEVMLKGRKKTDGAYNVRLKKIKGAPCEIESGQRAIEDLLRSRAIRTEKADWKEAEAKTKKQKESDLEKIGDVKKNLLRRLYKALHPLSPLKRENHDLQLVQMWEDYDPRILSQFVREPIEKGTNLPNHLLLLAHGTYRQFINRKDFNPPNEGAIKVFEGYIGISDYKPQFRHIPVYEKGHPEYEQAIKDHIVQYKDLAPEFKDSLIERTNLVIEAQTLREDKMQEKWEMFLAHDEWCQGSDCPPDYKKQWNKEKKWCYEKLEGLMIKSNEVALMVWAADKLLKGWLKNEIPIIPTQKLIKEYLQKVEPMTFDEARTSSKTFWSGIIPDAKGWIYLPAGSRGAVKRD